MRAVRGSWLVAALFASCTFPDVVYEETTPSEGCDDPSTCSPSGCVSDAEVEQAACLDACGGGQPPPCIEACDDEHAQAIEACESDCAACADAAGCPPAPLCTIP